MNTAPVIESGAQALATRGQIIALDAEALIAKAIEHGVPVEALERLLAMRAELKREQARGAFARALADFQAEVPPIPKTRTASVSTARGSYRYHYADIADIQRAIAPRLKVCGLAVTFDTRAENDTLVVGCIVHHIDGHSIRSEFPMPIDRAARMNDTQKIGSALTYGRRYALCAALGIVTAEDDDDGRATEPPAAPVPQPAPNGAPQTVRHSEASIQPITDAQHRRLEARIHELGLDRERVKAWVRRAWGIEHLNAIPAELYTGLDRRLALWANEAEAAEGDAERAAIQAESAP
jgi:hypothetical protein